MGFYSGLTRFGLFLLTTTFLSCNQPPETDEIDEWFDNKGNVEYSVSGWDPDFCDYVDHILVEINDSIEEIVDGSSGTVLTKIILGENNFTAEAYDKHGEPDPIPAESSFYSLTQKEAEEVMNGIFEGRVGDYTSLEKKALVCLGASDDFLVDYLVRKTDDTDAIVNYVGYGKNLEDELANSELLGLYGIPNLYIVRVPEDEIRLRLNGFIDKGFND